MKQIGILALTGAIVLVGAEVGERLSIPGIYSANPASEARVGRPLTPEMVRLSGATAQIPPKRRGPVRFRWC